MLTTRDHQIIEFIQDYKVATTSTIAEIFFPSKAACYKRLEVIHQNKYIRRTRDFVSQEYIYHAKKDPPQQLKHSLLVTDFYRELHKQANEVITFKIEPQYGDIRPDAIFGYEYRGSRYMGFLEVEISNKGFNYAKYERFNSNDNYKSFNLPVMPTVFVVSNKAKIPDGSKVKYEFIKTDFSDFKL
jgi:hypothetical protein